MTNNLQMLFWLIMIVNAILLLVYSFDNVVLSRIFKRKIKLRLKNLENIVYKEDK